MGICGCKQLPGESGQITITSKAKDDISGKPNEDRDRKTDAKSREEEYFEDNYKQSTHLDNQYVSHKVNATGIEDKVVSVKKVEEINPSSSQPEYYASIGKNEYREPQQQEAAKEIKTYKEEQEYNGYHNSTSKERVVEEPAYSYNRKKTDKKHDKGDESFGYEYDNDDYGGGEDEEEIEIENTYFEADDKKTSRPKDAIEGFQTVIMLEENRSERKYTFQSLLNIILIKCKLQLYSDLSDDVTKILKAMDKVSKNDANDAINSILEALLNLEDQNQADKAIVKILDYLKDKNYEQLWLNASIRLCKIYLDRKEYTQFQNLIESIKESCRLPDGSDDMKKSSVLLEVYSLEINLHMQTMNLAKIKEIYDKTKNISSAIADPRTMGIIKETHGKMLMIEKDWENARLELFEAFKYYQEVGSIKAKSMLKYVVIVSILAQSTLNPFDNVEAKVYREDSEIKLMDNLRTAYEQKNGKELIRIMGSQKYKIFDEQFIQQFEEDLMNIMCLEMIVALAAPYKKMKFDYLQRELNLTEKQVESYISRLILDRKLNGKIDLMEGYFENFNAKRNDVEEKKNEALFHWIKSLANVNVY